MIVDRHKVARSMNWLYANYSHIWDSPDLLIKEKAGFLAACCDGPRCYLSMLDLRTRLNLIDAELRK